ncbi:hypothetical protein EAS56_23900 [Bradyrhizobium guangzhouense]|uniref:Uncharacterized protein n=1 Tax=Bradyrhizobium guangzhouense TaxID=1325095 RepID=A0ABY0E4C0_9BRAD|nr:hypothetical protein EAS56_23900 [Bradyrhizobium guangzhouense]
MQNIGGLMQPLKHRFGWRRIPRALAAEDSAAPQRKAIQATPNAPYKFLAGCDDPGVRGTASAWTGRAWR